MQLVCAQDFLLLRFIIRLDTKILIFGILWIWSYRKTPFIPTLYPRTVVYYWILKTSESLHINQLIILKSSFLSCACIRVCYQCMVFVCVTVTVLECSCRGQRTVLAVGPCFHHLLCLCKCVEIHASDSGSVWVLGIWLRSSHTFLPEPSLQFFSGSFGRWIVLFLEFWKCIL